MNIPSHSGADHGALKGLAQTAMGTCGNKSLQLIDGWHGMSSKERANFPSKFILCLGYSVDCVFDVFNSRKGLFCFNTVHLKVLASICIMLFQRVGIFGCNGYEKGTISSSEHT